MNAIRPLLDMLSSRSGTTADVRDWRLFWSSRESVRVGVKDGARAGVHAPLSSLHLDTAIAAR